MTRGTTTFYSFQSEWVLDAPIDRVFELLLRPDSAEGPASMTTTVLERGNESGLGRRAAYRIRSPFLYAMKFESEVIEIDPPKRLRSAVEGDLEGTGEYLLDRVNGTTSVRFDWQVATTKPWMNRLAPVARPLFVRAHHKVMDQLIEAMARDLNARLVSSTTRLLPASEED